MMGADQERFVPRHAGIILLVGLSVVFDGFDTYTLGLTIPQISREWAVAPPAFAKVAALFTVAIVAGSALAGVVGDRIGRKRALIVSTLLFGAGSLISALAGGMPTMLVSRLIAGLGIGGAIVTAVVSISEYVPARQRSSAIALAAFGGPVGHALAGITATLILERFGWRSLFLIGAGAPLLIAAIQICLLPETPSFLRLRAARGGTASDAEGHERGRRSMMRGAREALGAVLARDCRGDTLLLWAAIAVSLFITYSLAQWLPSLITRSGATVTQAAKAIACLGAGQIAGGLFAAPIVYWFGTRRPVVIAGAAIMSLCAVNAFRFDRHPASLSTNLVLFLTAAAIAIVIQLYHTLFPALYSERIRGTGTGIGLAIGRLGVVVSAFSGAWSLNAGGEAFFGLLVGAAMVQLAAFALIGRHAPNGRSVASGR